MSKYGEKTDKKFCRGCKPQDLFYLSQLTLKYVRLNTFKIYLVSIGCTVMNYLRLHDILVMSDLEGLGPQSFTISVQNKIV